MEKCGKSTGARVTAKQDKDFGGDAAGNASIALPRLSQQSTAPLYEVVKRHLSEAILLGKWPPGTALPSEVALAQMLGVAVGTVRHALGDLTSEGLISRRRKIGTVVTGRSPYHSLRYFFQYFRLHKSDGTLQTSVARVVRISREEASESIRTQLELEPGAEVIKLERVREIEGRPVMRDLFAFASERVPDFPMSAAKVPQSVYIYLLEQHGIRISAVREEIRASLATPEDCELLKLVQPAALLTIQEVAFDQANRPMIYGEKKASTENHMYINEIR
jgi:GntR family transcriptional regulator